MTSKRARLAAASAALLCVAGLTWGTAGVGAGGPAAEGPVAEGPVATTQAAPSTPPESPDDERPAAVSATPTTPPPAPATASEPPAPAEPPAPTGLTGPVSAVLEDAPAAGPVRVVTLTQDAGGRPRITVTTAANRDQAATAVEEGRATPGALAVSIDQPVRAAEVGEPILVDETVARHQTQGETSAAASNDALRGLQWALDTLQAEIAWGLHTAAGQTVAVIDSGVDGTHPDLASRLLPGTDLVDLGGDGRIDPNGHGTHVAGIIGATADNVDGVAGLARDANLLPVRVLDAGGAGWSSDVAEGIIWAVDHGATTLNLSLGSPSSDPTTAAAVSYAQSKDVVVVAAAGNARAEGSPISYPAAYPGVVAVAATDSADASGTFSNVGSYVTLAAPGVDIASTYPTALGASYASMSGTSMAAPYAAAAVALVRAADPAMTATAVVDTLVVTSRDLGAAGRDAEFGAGLIDALAALQSIHGSTFHPLVPARLLDTRTGMGAPAAPVGHRGTVGLQVTGVAGVPTTGVTAVALNVTAVSPAGSGFVTAYPAGRTRPVASNLNTIANVTVPNLVVVKVGTGGKVNLYAQTGTVHLVADIAGYYSDQSISGSPFHSLPPSRVLDTRTGAGAPAAPVGHGGTISVQVTGVGGVPATGVSAVALNVTAVSPTAGGFVTAYPAGQPRPVASNLNTRATVTVPNLVLVKVGTGGKVNLYAQTGTVHFVADIAGYYSDQSLPGSPFRPLAPARVLDTRTGVGAPLAPVGHGGTLSLQVAGVGGVPATGVSAVALNVTAVSPTAGGFVTAYPAGQQRPVASNLNTRATVTVPNLVLVKVGTDGKVNLYAQTGTVHFVADIAGYYTGS